MRNATDEQWMRRAIEVARRGWGKTHPNPVVGAVLVGGDECLAEGFHEVAGGPHAEVMALQEAGWGDLSSASRRDATSSASRRDATSSASRRDATSSAWRRDATSSAWRRDATSSASRRDATSSASRRDATSSAWRRDATLYVTLEPCSTVGRTGACTDAIIQAGIRRVVVGALDDNPRHRGRGLEVLRGAGVVATAGILEEECRDLNLIFHFCQREGRPFIAAKVASSIDGRTATESGASKWITGEKSRENVHWWRRYFPAIAVGARTVLADDPELTARQGPRVHCPVRIVFDRSGRLAAAPQSRVFTDSFRDRTVVMVSASAREKLAAVVSPEVRLVACPEEGPVAPFLLDWMRENELGGLYVEGGSALHSRLFAERAVDYLFAYRAPKLFFDERARVIGGGLRIEEPSQAISLEDCRHEIFGMDQLIRGRVHYPERMVVE